MKLFLYIALGFLVIGGTVLLITRGQAPDTNPALLFVMVVLFAIPPIGAFWMMYNAIRYERHPFPLIALAMFIPFVFLWYYFARVRPGKHRTRIAERQAF